MTKQNQGTFARHSEMHVDTVGLNEAMGDFQISSPAFNVKK
jgi:hypothetical protein